MLTFLVSIEVMKWTLLLQSKPAYFLFFCLGLGLLILANKSYRTWTQSISLGDNRFFLIDDDFYKSTFVFLVQI